MLFCILGNSGVGKDTVITETISMAEKDGIKIKRLPIYTTRPVRQDEAFNPDLYYKFVDDSVFFLMRVINNEMIEHRSYTVADGSSWFYGTTKNDFENAIISNDIYLVPCTLSMFKTYYEYLRTSGSLYNLLYKLYPIYITAPSEKVRLSRLIARAKTDAELYEACRRFAIDVERIDDKIVPEQFTVVNDNVSDTACYILSLIDTFIELEHNDPWLIDCTCRETFGGLVY